MDKKSLSKQIGIKETRKLRAQRRGIKTIWYGLGMMGLIGWSVAIPTLAGVLLGLWLDQKMFLGRFWTLDLLVIGLLLGCLNAWRWLKKEDQKIRDEQEKDHD